MNVTGSNINKLINVSPLSDKVNSKNYLSGDYRKAENVVVPGNYNLGFLKNGMVLPYDTVKQSRLSVSTPISYSQIGEIFIPGLKDKARIYKLANGQRVIIAKKKGAAVIKTTYNVGSMNEHDNFRGISHFIEHNLFNGSKNLAPREYVSKVSQLGAITNASTSFSSTDYFLYLQLLKENSLESAIELNALQTQYPTFPINQLIKEKEPVKSEIDMCSDNPKNMALQRMLKNLFKIKTNSEDFIIGTKDNINSFSRDDIIDYFNTWYTPDNAVTVITGDVDFDETIKLVSKHFNKQNDYSNINKRYNEPIQYNNSPVREDIIKQNTTQPEAILGFALPEGTSEPEINKLDVLFSILQSTDSKLYKELDNLGAVLNISYENMQNKPQSAKAVVFDIQVPEENIESALNVVYRGLIDISNNPPSIYELENVKRKLINQTLSLSESSFDLNNILTTAALNSDYDYINSLVKNIQNVTPYDISESARKYLDLNKISICVSHSNKSTETSVHQNFKAITHLKRDYKGTKNTVVPDNHGLSFGKSLTPIENLREEKNKIQNMILPNNIYSSVINGNEYAKSYICLNFRTDELNEINSPSFMVLNKLLERGSNIKGANGFNNVLNIKDISISCYSDVDGLFLTSECNSEDIQDTLKLIKEKLIYPNFTQEEFLRAKQFVYNSICSENVSAYDNLAQEIFPEIKKYKDKETRFKELETLKLEDIQTLYAKIFNTSNVQAILTTSTEKNPNLINIFNNELSIDLGNFRPFSPLRGDKYNIYKPNLNPKTFTTKKEQAQAEIMQSYTYKKPDNIDDIAKIDLLNMILGGSMSSRLFCDLREDKKLAYSVSSAINSEKNTGILNLLIETTTDNSTTKEGSPENVTKALNGFKRNIDLLKTENVSLEELENAKTKYKRDILNALETNKSKTLTCMKSKYSYYGNDYNEKLYEAIERVTAEDIKAAANYVFKNPPVTSIAASVKTLEALNNFQVNK